MPLVNLTIPSVNVTLDVPPDFAAYVTLDDLREMALQILSVDHIGQGIDTICRIRRGEKQPEWTEAMVRFDEDLLPAIGIEVEDDGFAALEQELAAITHGTLSLTASFQMPGHEPELVSISGPFTRPETDSAMRYFFANLESFWKAATA
jgi:hypothetical protein